MHADTYDLPTVSQKSHRVNSRSKRILEAPSPMRAWNMSSGSFVFWELHRYPALDRGGLQRSQPRCRGQTCGTERFQSPGCPRTSARPRWVQARHRVGTRHQPRHSLRHRRHHRRRRQGCGPHDRERHPNRPNQGYPPTGKRFSVDYVHWVRLADGKVAELWAVRDDLSRLQQLDLIPVPSES
jgi:hypothetical protein